MFRYYVEPTDKHQQRYPVRQGQVEQELTNLFFKSEIWAFYQFLNTPQASGVIKISPQQDQNNPNKFYFSPSQLRRACSGLKDCGYSLMKLFQRHGLNVEQIKEAGTANPQWCVYHQSLSLRSTPQQIMKAWVEGQRKNFLEGDSMFKKMYAELIKPDGNIYWNEEGTAFFIEKQSELYRPTIISQLKVCRFRTSKFPLISHRVLRKQSEVTDWMCFYVKHMTRKRQGRKRLKMSKINQENGVKQEQSYYDDSKSFAGVKQQHFEGDEEEQKIFLQNDESSKPIPPPPKYKNSKQFKQVIKQKTAKVKSMLSAFQSDNIFIELGHIFLIVDEILKTSNLQKINDKKDQKPNNDFISHKQIEELIKEVKYMRKKMEEFEKDRNPPKKNGKSFQKFVFDE